MIPLFEAAWEIHQFFTQHQIRYAFIGGFVVPQWGVPRFTTEVDEVLAPLEQGSKNLVRRVLSRFSSRDPDPFLRARRDQVILISASNGRGIDISFGVPGYQDKFLRRAVDYELEPGKVVRFCSAEDLIIHKCVAGRPQDLRDVDGVIARQRDALELAYIRKWLRYFDGLLPEAIGLAQFERAWRAEKRALKQKPNHPVKRK